jgi:L-seryl-tRNA(Ser) seleniumtransferase
VVELATETADALDRSASASLRNVINATGVILHTNLGRAPLSTMAASAMAAVASSYSNLEFDLLSGERGSRSVHLRQLLRDVTGAEDGLAVNNGASAVLLALSALAAGREVVVSRGQAVEIGGGFRIPDVMRQSGTGLVEVGTTNRTYAADYSEAIGPNTAAVLRVHPSNFRVEGFVHSVGITELVELAHGVDVPVIDDVGSGALLDPRPFGLGDEPTVQESVRAGADVVCFSGDKLLGGPQAGIIVGRQRLLDTIRKHPLARAVRIDKVSLAGLEATLRHYLRGEALTAIPVWRMIATPVDRLNVRAMTAVAALGSPRAHVVETRATVGGGSLPQETLPSVALAIGPDESENGWSVSTFARQLRLRSRPIVGRIERNTLLLDYRTIFPEDDTLIVEALRATL